MIDIELGDLARLLEGRLVLAGTDSATTVVGGSVETDSRKVSTGSIFFAMPGEVTDGHLFAPAALEAGAVLVIAERELDLPVSQIIVANGVRAIGALAREVVARVRSLGALQVVAVTGSNGKTTTKNMLRAILEASPVPLSWADPTGRVEFWSPGAEALLGYSAAEIGRLRELLRNHRPKGDS